MEVIMKTTSKTLLAATAIVLGAAFVIPAFAQGPGYGMRSGMGYGPDNCPRFSDTTKGSAMPYKGMGYGRGRMGGGPGGGLGGGMGWMMRGDLNLTAEKVKDIFEGRIAMHGNDNVKVGEVKAADDGNFTVTIVTKDGSLVQTMTVNKDTGRPTPVR